MSDVDAFVALLPKHRPAARRRLQTDAATVTLALTDRRLH